MAIEYSLSPNKLLDGEVAYSAQVRLKGSYTTEDLIERMMQQGSTLTRADCAAAIENFMEAARAVILEGGRVNFAGMVDLFPSIKGKFTSLTDSYDPARHQVDVSTAPGSELRKEVRMQAVVEKQETVRPEPSPLEVIDLASGDVNSVVTPGNIVTLNGKRVSFDPEQADEGLYFIQTDGQGTVKIPVESFQKNKPSQLVFLLPANMEAAQAYYVELRARPNGVEDLRAGRLGVPVSVP